MQFDVLTTFPEMVSGPLGHSMLGRALAAGVVTVQVHNLREWTIGPHYTTDDEQYGGGDGMVMLAEPIATAVEQVLQPELQPGQRRVLVTSPQGRKFDQALACDLALAKQIVIICGHYKGIDERLMDYLQPEEVSIGDYVLTGGELPAVLMIDAIARLVPGVVGGFASVEEDSFYRGLLDCPRYTRPREWRGLQVPEVLLSGNHSAIARWRKHAALERTQQRRPDLYARYMARQGEAGPVGSQE